MNDTMLSYQRVKFPILDILKKKKGRMNVNWGYYRAAFLVLNADYNGLLNPTSVA